MYQGCNCRNPVLVFKRNGHMCVVCNFQPLARNCGNVKVTSVEEKKKYHLRLEEPCAWSVDMSSVSQSDLSAISQMALQNRIQMWVRINVADTMTSPVTEVGNESLDDDNDSRDVLFPDRWLSSPVLCCAVSTHVLLGYFRSCKSASCY